ncbi:MAG TPA: hypothetical protein VHV30_14875 [Polyangiaceae bacterium]|jgi:hypothetical protein|nr:hypothetical protein [Polyangiaceae bacterium]
MQSKPRAALQTFHALQASDMASAFNDALKKVRLQPGDYAPELTTPEGQSTGGGVLANQRLRLVSSQGLPALVVGAANHAEKRAELRTFEHLDAVHVKRFRRPVAIDRTQYEDFLRLAKQLLDALQLRTTLVGPPTDLEDENSEVRSGGHAGRWVLAFLLGAIVTAAVGFGIWRLGLLKSLAG